MTLLKRTHKLAKIAMAVRKTRRTKTDGEQKRAQVALAELFADARGGAMKIGQMFSEIGGETPFIQLTRGVAPYPFEDMLPELEQGLGQPVEDVFESLDDTGIAASLGQVHRGVLLDGTDVAVKIRYPGIVSAVEAEMKLVGMIPGVGPAKKWGIDLDGYKRSLKENMDRELDYRTEARRQSAFRAANKVADLCVPEIIPHLCSEGVLVQRWEDGRYLEDIVNWSENDRHTVARIVLSTLFHCLFVSGTLHGDPHMGNALYRKTARAEPEVVLLDYGCTVDITEPQRAALLELIIAVHEGQNIPAFDCLCDMGFEKEKLEYIREDLVEAMQVLLAPFKGEALFDPETWPIQQRFEDLMGERRWWLRSAGPPESLFCVRIFHGAISQMKGLGINLSWWHVLQATVGPEAVQAATMRLADRRKASNGLTTSPKPVQEEDRPVKSKELRVLVTENDKRIVSITMPARAAYDLIDIMPEDVITHIRATGALDLEEVVSRVKQTQAEAQSLFEHDREARHYRVWLE
jgi:predicted unusual protein kinase regulating ubiquinone biosynthesis (AarF/ABC1/UbiB family)